MRTFVVVVGCLVLRRLLVFAYTLFSLVFSLFCVIVRVTSLFVAGAFGLINRIAWIRVAVAYVLCCFGIAVLT